jgi:hypothetical protein
MAAGRDLAVESTLRCREQFLGFAIARSEVHGGKHRLAFKIP